MTVPNLITVIRIILVPIFVIYIMQGRLTAALVVFMIAGISDGIDGFLARVLNQKSRLGAFLDPLADKILLVSAFVMLSVREFMPSWLTVIVISRDVLILLGVLILFMTSTGFTVKPSLVSKATTCFQLAAVFIVLSRGYTDISFGLQRVVCWATAAITIISGLHYMRQWFRMMGEEQT